MKRQSETHHPQHKTFFLYCGILMLLSEIWKQWCLTYLVNHGTYYWWHFPFQLCSIPMYICLILPWVNSTHVQSVLLAFLMDFGLMGGIFTFFDTSGMHYSYTPLTIHSFAWHILLIIIGIYAGLGRKADYSNKGYLKTAGIYLACCLIATFFNILFHHYGNINMFYISPYYHMRQKAFHIIAMVLGDGVGIAVYIAACLFGAWILHQMWRKVTGDGGN
ncbi:hypothetical protein ACQRBN_02050 [Bariatricus sp. SGI.154]|uniref:TMEM164 family acyltransferase n=1 Tax=Bariatricus sp. SGI.154 TaxID=3420549 RepID=UPI003CFE7BCE